MIVESIVLGAALLLWLVYLEMTLLNRSGDKKRFRVLAYLALACQLAWVVIRSVSAKHVPFSGAYESMAFFSFLYAARIALVGSYSERTRAWLSIPAALLLIVALLLPSELKEISALLPALRSFWIYIHVPAFFVGYVSLTLALITGIIAVVKKRELSETFRNEIKLAFFFISLGIITGSFWGKVAWGSFWNWDPKEIWALVTWLLLSVSFHGKSDRFRLLFVVLAFLAMIFTYLGVMFLLSGLHSYV